MIARIACCSVFWVALSAALLAAAGGLGSVGLAGQRPLPVQIEVKLINAVFRGDDPGQNHAALLLKLNKVGDRWERVVGTAGDLSRGIDTGYVAEGEMTDDAIRLVVRVHIVGDGYTRIDERAEYGIELKRTDGRRFAGTWNGNYKGAKRQGRAEAELLPPLKPPPAGFEPIEPGEHPRLLFRKDDLPGLREKAETPFGKAALAKMNDAVGLGVKYQLTGDKKHAEESRKFVERFLDGDYSHARAPGSHHGMLHWAAVWEQPAVAYDLCYDAWPEDFKRRVETFLWLWTRRIFNQHMMFNTQAQYDFGNGEAMWFHFGPALAGVAFWGEKGPEPAAPLKPDPIEEVPPAEGYEPGKGVPVVAIKPGEAPSSWLYHRPIPHYVEADPLEPLGGWQQCRPEPGASFTYGGEKYTFQPLPPEHVPDGGGVILNIGKGLLQKYRGHVKTEPGPEIALDGPITMCLFTVLKNDRPRQVKVFAPFSPNGWQQFVLAGHSLAHGQVVRLERGLYPLLVVLRIQARWSHLKTRLDEATAEDARASALLLDRLQKRYEEELKDWQWDVAEWQRTGGFNQTYRKMFETTRFVMYLHCREGVGTGGAQSVAWHNLAVLPANYALAYRTAFGVDVSPYPDLTHFVPRRIFAHVYPKEDEPFSLSVNGPDDVGADYFALHFPIVPDEWKPAALWAWQRFLGFDDANAEPEKLLSAEVDSTYSRAFVNYPLDMKPRPPQGVLPLTWEAPTYGYYGLRNKFGGEDSFLVQLYGRCHPPHGYNVPNAGNFVIWGLGHPWARSMPSLRLHNQRAFSNVVLLPDDETNEDALGRVLYAKTEKDGSGAVTFDLDDLYAAAKLDRKGRPMRLYEKYGGVRIEPAFRQSGITGLRAFGVDYSGRCGAPCLFVVADKITGGSQKLWMWRLKGQEVDEKTGAVLEPSDLEYTTVEGNTVTLARPDGTSMRLTFVSPARLELKAETRNIVYSKTYNRGKGTMSAPGIYARTDAKEAEFFVVVTIQRGDPPPVKQSGKGLAATVTVGKQTVRFDGEKVVVGVTERP